MLPKQQVAIFSLEMSAEQLATPFAERGIPGFRRPIRRGEIEQKEFDKFVEVSQEIGALPLQIDDTRGDQHVDAAHALPAIATDQGPRAGRR